MPSEEYERRQFYARQFGYESDYERQQVLAAARAGRMDIVNRRLGPIMDRLESQQDPQSMGMIFRDVYQRLQRSGRVSDERITTILRGIVSPNARGE